jgi:adenosylhomocysteine nucleosidase
LLVFVAAERRELEGLLAHMEGLAELNWNVDFGRVGQLHGVQVAVVANGPGPKLAGEAVDAVREYENVDSLISIGFCGGLTPALGPCDIFIASEVVGVGPALAPAGCRPCKTGKLLSIDRVVSTAAEKAELAKTGADAVEMEAAAVAARAKQGNVPFYAVRVVTDACNESFSLNFNQLRNSDGRFSRAKILRAALHKPRIIFPELMKLNQRTKCAAQALGDFLADARF